MKQTPKRLASSKNIPKRRVSTASNAKPSISAFPTFNIPKIINGISSFHSTIQNFNQSLQRLESIMTHTSKIFNFGRNMRFPSSRPFFPELPKPPVGKQVFDGEEIPIINLPKTPPNNNPFVRLFENVDMNEMMKMFQSPGFRNILSQMFPTKQATPKTRVQRPRKQIIKRNINRTIRRKRVKP